jgi:hypothetical protein
MLTEYSIALEQLRNAGWFVRLRPSNQMLPSEIKTRYNWIPADVEQFIKEIELVASPDEKAWLLGMPDFLNTSSSAFKWDEWEQQSLAAAEGNSRRREAIRDFWDQHFPVAMSVKSGYAYFAIQKSNLSIVCGEEPEFEEAVLIASSFLNFLNLLVGPDPKLNRWV